MADQETIFSAAINLLYALDSRLGEQQQVLSTMLFGGMAVIYYGVNPERITDDLDLCTDEKDFDKVEDLRMWLNKECKNVGLRRVDFDQVQNFPGPFLVIAFSHAITITGFKGHPRFQWLRLAIPQPLPLFVLKIEAAYKRQSRADYEDALDLLGRLQLPVKDLMRFYKQYKKKFDTIEKTMPDFRFSDFLSKFFAEASEERFTSSRIRNVLKSLSS